MCCQTSGTYSCWLPILYCWNQKHVQSFRAGFCKGRSCGDQITRIVQAIIDGFQPRRMKCFVLTVLDFSKAYNTVWRENLLLQILNTGIPTTFIRAIRVFFHYRRRRVQLFNFFSSSRHFIKVYLKVLFLLLYSSCSTLTIWPPLHSTTMQLLPYLAMTSLSSLLLENRKMLKLLPSQ